MSDEHPVSAPLHQLHDHFFRKVFGNPKHARGLFQRVVPESLARDVDWSTLVLRSTSHIDDGLGEVLSDLVFTARLADSDQEVLLDCVYLLEHQSSPDTLMALRIWAYACGAVKTYLRETKRTRMPKVVPVLFYQHTQGWTRPRRLSELQTPMEPVFVECAFLVHETAREELREIQQCAHYSPTARVAEVLLKMSAEDIDLRTESAFLAPMMVDVIRTDGAEAFAHLAFYAMKSHRDQESWRHIMSIVHEQEPQAVEGSIYHQVLAEERAEGRVEGQAWSVLKILESRSIEISEASKMRIVGCRDSEIVEDWLMRAFTVSHAEALFEEPLQ